MASSQKTRIEFNDNSPAAIDLHEKRVIFMNAARNGVLPTFQNMPRVYQSAALNWQDKDGRTPLMQAAANGREAVVQILLGMRADIALQDHNGWTALTHAAHAGNAAIAAALLDGGADIDWQDKEGWTPLMDAVNAKQGKIVSLLLDRGCRLDLTGAEGMTALDLALDNGSVALAEMIQTAATSRRLAAELDGISGGLPQDISVSRPQIRAAKRYH